jgi:hypothetical protein
MKHTPYDPVEPHDPVSPRQVAPNPQSELDANVDRRQAVLDEIRAHPQATVDEVVARLAGRQIEVSPVLVMQELMHGQDSANA